MGQRYNRQLYNDALGFALRYLPDCHCMALQTYPTTPADNGCVQNRDLIHLHYPEIPLSPINYNHKSYLSK